jgi:glutamate synthase domain-containing protein 2
MNTKVVIFILIGSILTMAVYTLSTNLICANAANSPKVFTNNGAPSASSGEINNIKKTGGTYLNKTVEILPKDLINSNNNNTNGTSTMSTYIKTMNDERAAPVKNMLANSSERKINNSTNSSVMDLSRTRQTPNFQFGSLVKEGNSTHMRIGSPPPFQCANCTTKSVQ